MSNIERGDETDAILVDEDGSTSNSSRNGVTSSLWDANLQKRRTLPVTLASLCVCGLVTLGVLVYCFLKHTGIEYEVDSDIRKVLMENNITAICYKQVKTRYSFPLLYNVSLGLMGVIVSTVVDRLCLVAEEFRHISTRYDGKICKMFKACFSGIQWPAVIALLAFFVLGNIVFPLATGIEFDWKYVVYVFSGMGAGPLIMQLLNLNTQSEVYISTIIEEKENYHAYALAWSYFANCLGDMLPKFNTGVTDLVATKKLSSKKLVLLLSDNARMPDLSRFDSNIEYRSSLKVDDKYQVKIYSFKIDDKEYRYGVKYVEEPLAALDMMGKRECHSVPNKSVNYHVKLLYKGLNEILNRRENDSLQDMCVVIPIKTKNDEKLACSIHDMVKGDPYENTTQQSTSGENQREPQHLPERRGSAPPTLE